ncbi:MAG: PAS domain S-box protein [Deltaproteobacteria bacterium]|nr:PAS domain S-box protein [Deltaproteobacteria bacterium]
MRLKLSTRFNLYIGLIIILGISTLLFFDLRSNSKLLSEIGFSEAERLGNAVFDQLYTTMRLGGGRAENRAIIQRFKQMENIDEIRVIHGPALDRQYGMEEDELPMDAFERAALEGNISRIMEKVNDSSSARVILPIFLKEDCMRCHIGKAGDRYGAISVRISLNNYRDIISGHTRNFLFWGGGIFALISVAILLIVHKRFLEPLEKLKKGAEELAKGNLKYRVEISTGDELEDLGKTFDNMAESLLSATGRLKEINEKYLKLVQMAPDAILLKDIQTGRFIDMNPAAVILMGYAKEELSNMDSEQIYPKDKVREYKDVFRRWLHDGKGYLHNAEIIKKDGFTVPVEIAASVIELNRRKYIQEIWRDLSERRGLEETIRRHITELEAVVRDRTAELNRSLAELELAYDKLRNSEQRLIQSAKLISLGEMGAGIAHELNSPLAGILTLTELLLSRMPKDDTNYRFLEKIKDAVVRSKYIILDMLTYSRPSRGEFTPMFLNESIRATLLLFTSELKTSSLEIIENFDPDLPKVFGNKGQIMEVILNIIKNARDALGGNGRLFITTKSVKEGSKEFAVAGFRDTGPGIPKDIMDKIFDPFFTTKEKGGGMNIGLGLSISQSIIKEHGGRIEVESSPGKGAKFSVYLPVYKEQDKKE